LILLILFLPLFADFLTPVLTLRPPYVLPFVATITAGIVIADAVIDAQEWGVARLVAFVLTVEPWKGKGDI